MANGFDRKLAALVEEARRDAPKAVWVALYMVNACYVHGKHRLLAKHICTFSGLDLSNDMLVETAPKPAARVH